MKESNLVFLISQPRSGSTLLQKLLSQNNKILTLSEPWLMLHPAYSLKSSGIYTEYDKETEINAISNFIENIPGGGRELYIKRLRSMYLSLYDAYLKDSGKTFFLDKTPRYYHVIRELKEIFPDAKYIYLRRNPMSVLYSIVMTWNDRQWHTLSNYKHDLLTAIEVMGEVAKNNSDLTITYEELVDNPKKELQKITSYIGIPFEENMMSYNNREKWIYGDQNCIYSHDTVSSERVNIWMNRSLSQQLWRVLSDYLDWIGKDRLEISPYNFDELRFYLDENMPEKSLESIKNKTFSLMSLLDNPKNCLIENHQLREKITEQEKEVRFYKKIRGHIDKHVKVDGLRQPLAKIRTYKYFLEYYKSLISLDKR